MSPVLFNIFINDLMDGAATESGVQVPYGKKDTWWKSSLKIGGALFADDAVGLCPDLEHVKIFCDRVTTWCSSNEMAVGIHKCGILEVRPDTSWEKVLIENNPEYQAIKLSGDAVPIVEKYKYLGIYITENLEVEEMVGYRYDLGRKMVGQLRRFLCNDSLAMSMRLQIVRAVVLQVILYGAEIYGMNRSITNKMQQLVTTCLRFIAGITYAKRDVASVPLWKEFGVEPVCALGNGRRIRGWMKCQSLRTFVHNLVEKPMVCTHWHWASGVVKWMQRHCMPWFAKVEPPIIGPWKSMEPGRLAVGPKVYHLSGSSEQMQTQPPAFSDHQTVPFDGF